MRDIRDKHKALLRAHHRGAAAGGHRCVWLQQGDGSMVLSWAEAAYTRSGGDAARPRQLPGVRGLGDGGLDQMVRVGWAGEQYSLYRRHPASDSWTTEATQLQVPAESCSEYIYAMTVTVEAEVNGFELKTGEVNTMCEVSFDTGGGGPRHNSCVGSRGGCTTDVDTYCLDNYYLDGDM